MTTVLPILDTQHTQSGRRPVYAQGPRSLASVRLLRLSVTDRCNLRCVYCMPDDGVTFYGRADLLAGAEIVAVAAAAAFVGVDHFKITGGEPTVRPDLLDIVEGIADHTDGDLSMITNGLMLDRLAHDLRAAGLQRITVSCDSLQSDRYHRITGGRHGPDALSRMWCGIDAAVAAGFEKIKINVVVMAGVNDDEAADFARLTLDRPWTVRFIEYMPLGRSALDGINQEMRVDNARVGADIERRWGPLQPVDRKTEAGVGPADIFQIDGALGRIGFISSMSEPFCQKCNRLRLTARGELRSCLFDGGEVDVIPALRPTPDRDRLVEVMRHCTALKPEVHCAHGNRPMSQLGG